MDGAKNPEDSQLLSFHCLVEGTVQGVGFRNWTRRRARALGIGGWVRNNADRVELMFSATTSQAAAFEMELKAGPSRATVSDVAVRHVKQRQFRTFKVLGSKGTPPTAAASQPPKIELHFDPSYVVLCQRVYDALPKDLRTHNRVETVPSDWGFGQLEDAAEQANMVVMRVDQGAPRQYLIEDATTRFGMSSTRLSSASQLDTLVANDKSLTMAVLQHADLPTPESHATDNLSDARSLFDAQSRPIVLKPSHGSNSDGITTNVADGDALVAAFAAAQHASPDGRVIVENYVCGVDLRVLLAGDTFVVAYLRLPANVIGNGKDTIDALVEQKNKNRATLPGIGPQNPIPRNALTEDLMKHQDLSYDSVPNEGQFVLMGLRPNTSDGADQITITDLLHPTIRATCINAAKILGAGSLWGFDILSEDFTRSIDDACTVFCEANNRPFGGVFRHATHGDYVNFFESALKSAVPGKWFKRWKSSTWELHVSGSLSPKTKEILSTIGDIQSGSTTVIALGKIRRDEALRHYAHASRDAQLRGRIILVDTKHPIHPITSSDMHTSQEALDSIHMPDDLTTAIAERAGDETAHWQTDILARKDTHTMTLWDTKAPTSLAAYLSRPKRLISLRTVLGSAGIPMTELTLLHTPKDVAELTSKVPTSGMLHLSRNWRKRVSVAISNETDFTRLADRIPPECYPLRMEAWSTSQQLEVVVVSDTAIAAAIRDGETFRTLISPPPTLIQTAEAAAAAIPGFGRGRFTFRLSSAPLQTWRLQCLSARLAHIDFAKPTSGPPTDIAAAIADVLEENQTKVLANPDKTQEPI
ncbi:acylphosphatase [Shimia sp.]|uniref:acylphosphatase n=1 Tax=Shimia sp. TaxID=1954381 RepID=UPI003B8DC3B1